LEIAAISDGKHQTKKEDSTMKRFTVHLVLALVLGAGLVVALLWLTGHRGITVAAAPERRSLAGGEVITVCLDGGCDYSSIQAAVDAAQPGAVIKVAAGVYTGVNNYGGLRQVVYISKTVTIRGGYTTTNWMTSYPVTQPTTLDAEGQGRVIFITGDISPAIEGLRITGGNAEGLGGDWVGSDGGGIYILKATAVISGNQVFSNAAGSGAGVFIEQSATMLNNNTIYSNRAITQGGGVQIIWESNAVLIGNSVTSNTAHEGGGVCIINSSGVTEVVLISNTIADNHGYVGAGVFAAVSRMTFRDNRIVSNTVIPGSTYWGSGVYLQQATGPIVFTNDTIAFNTGDGVYASLAGAQFNNSRIVGNSGTGLSAWIGSFVFTNTVVADNADGLSVSAGQLHLVHTTVARNTSGDGVGIEVWSGGSGMYSTVAMTNTILVSHSVGISVTSGNTVTVNGILWDPGTPITVSQGVTAAVMIQNQYTGDPAFATDGYHLTAGSAARDRGGHAGVESDIDGEPRLGIPDLGADEWVGHVFLPLVLRNF